ncbi:NOB1 [Symbiodinium sp. CCMP2456]|nr:NOB1 [Symbiodinium sp. CCMP2456]
MATLWEQGAADRQVVIDAGAAIRLKRLERFGGELLTTSGVYAEVRDEHARALLQTLPVELKVLEPRPEDIAFAKQFSKATGDFGFLSTNDLDLIALTVRLHREAHLSLKDRPAALETRSEGRAVPFDWGPQRAPTTTSADAGGVQQPATEEDAQGDDGWAVARGRRTRGARVGGLKSDGQRAAELPQSVEDARTDEEAKTVIPPDQTAMTAPSVDTEGGGGIPRSDDEQAARETQASQDAGDAGAELQEDGELSEDGSSAGEWVTEENMHRFGIGDWLSDSAADLLCFEVLLLPVKVFRLLRSNRKLTCVHFGCWYNYKQMYRTGLLQLRECAPGEPSGCCDDLRGIPWSELKESSLFQTTWADWLRFLEAPGRCQRIPQPEGEVLTCVYRDGCLDLEDAAALLSNSDRTQAVLWTACAPLSLIAQLFWLHLDISLPERGLESQILARVPELLRLFVLHAGLRHWRRGSRGSPGSIGTAEAELEMLRMLHVTEGRVVGKLRSRLAEHRNDFSRCDVCCSDATCPHSEGTVQGLCPADTRFDAVQDLRDRLWSRAASVLDALDAHAEQGPGAAVPPGASQFISRFSYCDEVARERTANMSHKEEVEMLWTVLNFSSCAYHQVADFIYCHGQQRQDWQLFSAARMLQQAGTLVLLCTGCSSMWPLPFTLSDLWHNLYRSMDWAVKTMEMAQTGPPSPGSARMFVRALSSCQIWETEEPQTLSMDPERKLWLPDEAEGWKTCPLRLGPVQLVTGKLQVDVRVLRQPLLQACHAAVRYRVHPIVMQRSSALQSRDGTLLVLPLADLSFHISVAFRTWLGGALLLVHHLLGGPEKVTLLLADHDEAEPFSSLPRAVRYGGSHGGFGARSRHGNLSPLLGMLSHSRVLWLSEGSNARFADAVWGFPIPGLMHGRKTEYDCSGSFCFGLRRLAPLGQAAVTLRPALDHLCVHPARPRRRIRMLLVQRPRHLSRRIGNARLMAKLWQAAFPQLVVEIWRPELHPIMEQVRRMSRVEALAAVTGQACGLGAFLHRGSVLLEFTPALDGYGCHPGWDMNPTSEVGQIARLAEIHHRCVMSTCVGVAANTPLPAKLSAELALQSRATAGGADPLLLAEAGLTWRTAAFASDLPASWKRCIWFLPHDFSRMLLHWEQKGRGRRSKCAKKAVLLQMGITPLTFDGYAVKSVKLWGLICRACGHFHRDSSKVFCPKCGNDTVVRVPIVVDEDGVPTVVNSGRKLRTKGTVFSMPKPQSGRVWKPIFAEDRV